MRNSVDSFIIIGSVDHYLWCAVGWRSTGPLCGRTPPPLCTDLLFGVDNVLGHKQKRSQNSFQPSKSANTIEHRPNLIRNDMAPAAIDELIVVTADLNKEIINTS